MTRPALDWDEEFSMRTLSIGEAKSAVDVKINDELGRSREVYQSWKVRESIRVITFCTLCKIMNDSVNGVGTNGKCMQYQNLRIEALMGVHYTLLTEKDHMVTQINALDATCDPPRTRV